jgi:tRNA A-37 threonylcarbamoyl transferase component Bud32
MATLISGRYEILGKVGQGGMGTVYKARHTGLDTIVAVKLLPAELARDPELVARFRREARVMAQLKHEGIVKVFDIVEEDSRYYLIEEFIDGPDLGQQLRTLGPLPIGDALRTACQLARALVYAHGRGVVHRDIKPSNVLLEQGLSHRALLADFGIAKVEGTSEQTQTGTFLGSARYSAPEQLGYGSSKGKRRRIDARADVFSLGLVVFEMCEGRQFFAEMDVHEIIGHAVYGSDPLEPAFTQPVSGALVAALRRALERDPDRRYQSMREFLAQLEQCAGELADEEKTVVDRSLLVESDFSPDVSDQELERRYQALERERQRRQTLAAETEARAARHEATTVGAGELASDLFEEAAGLQERGASALEDSQFGQARELFEEATERFKKAASNAQIARALRDAEQARTATGEARAAAEREGASVNAETLYRRALELQNEGDRAWSREAHTDARAYYTEAHALYEEAGHAARRERQRTGAERARLALSALREEAEGAHAADLSATHWSDAEAHQRRAETEFADGQYEAAQRFFRAGADAYERALREAREAQARQRVLGARDGAQRAEAAARKAGAPRHAAPTHGAAVQALQRGEAALQGAAFDDAAAAFADASRIFEEAATQATAARAREEERAAALAAQARARDAASGASDARSHAEAECERGAELVRQGEGALEAESYRAAAAAFDEAVAVYGEAAAASAAARRREAEERARRRAAALAARARARDAASGASDARGHAEAEYERGVELVHRGDGALEAEDYDAAAAAFDGAVVAYGEAAAVGAAARRREAEELARLRGEAEAAREAACAAARKASDAGARGHAQYTEAESAFARGTHALELEDYRGAAAAYADAAIEYQRAAVVAAEIHQREVEERERQEREAAAARAHALEMAAVASAARQYAPGEYRDAEALFRRADGALGRGSHREAAASYAEAAEGYARAAAAAQAEAERRQAERDEQRRRAEMARARALEAARESEGAQTLAPEAHGRAERSFAHGERAFAAGEYTDAAESFALAAKGHEAAAVAAAETARREAEERERLRQEAESARARSVQAAAAAADARSRAPEAWERGEGAHGRGEQALADERHADAITAYDEAAAEYAAASSTASEARRREAVEAERRRQAEVERERQRLEVEEERQRREAESARQSASEAAAGAAEARHRAPDSFKRAEQAFRRGEKARRARMHREAVTAYREARTEYARSVAEAAAVLQREIEERERTQTSGPPLGSAAPTRVDARHVPDPQPAATGEHTVVTDHTVVAAAPQTAGTLLPGAAGVPVGEDSELSGVESPLARGTAARGRAPWIVATAAMLALTIGGVVWMRYEERAAPDRSVPVEPDKGVIPRPIPQELAWAEIAPMAEELQIAEGESLRFDVAIADGSRLAGLRYVWLLDGEASAEGASWQYTPGFDAAAAVAREIRVRASWQDRVVERAWRVLVTNTNRPPAIASAIPAGDVVEVAAGAEQSFSVVTSDPDLPHGDELTITWERNGTVVGSGPSWVLRDPAAIDTEVRVTVTDGEGASAPAHRWTLAVAAANRPPRIARRDPPTDTVTVREGGRVAFGVQAEDPDAGDELRYAWRLDGEEVGRGTRWEYRAPATLDAEVHHSVAVDVTDAKGVAAKSQKWQLEVTFAPPEIASYRPATRTISLDEGAPAEFSVAGRAADPRAPLQVEWTIDDARVRGADRERLALPDGLDAGTHTVAARVVDGRGLRSDAHRWTVRVAAVRPPVEARIEPPAAAGLSESEVRKWLRRYEEGFERKDVALLSEIGVVTSTSQRESLEKILEHYKQLDVAITKETIDMEGDQAVVSFNRVDTDESGKPIEIPERFTFRLRKGPDGRPVGTRVTR